jgi:tRNA threonylcarbamoyladenosine biosynthesis protein TsaB
MQPMHPQPTFNLLALDTSTDRLSLAVQCGGLVRHFEGHGGAQASATVVPAIVQLMAEVGLGFDALDAVVFGRGPGSFTGLRTACAVAQGLAFGARGGLGVPVLPIDTLAAIAEDARQQYGHTQVVVALDARMNEVYSAALQWQASSSDSAMGSWVCDGDFALLAPEALTVPAGYALVGNAGAVYGQRLAQGTPCADAWPTATALLHLAPSLLQAGMAVEARLALPLYIRDKVAQTTAERVALQAVAHMGPSPAPEAQP